MSYIEGVKVALFFGDSYIEVMELALSWLKAQSKFLRIEDITIGGDEALGLRIYYLEK